MPPVVSVEMPASLLGRFAGSAAESLMRMLVFLSPLTGTLITLVKAR